MSSLRSELRVEDRPNIAQTEGGQGFEKGCSRQPLKGCRMKPMSFLVVDDNSVALREIYEKNPEKAESYFRTALRLDPGFKDAR